MVTESFLDYTPVPLAFGTSGLRGLVKDITDVEAYINVKGALRYLMNIGDVCAGDAVVIAGDLRPSTDRIMRACAQAVIDSGGKVENAGKIPTPALISHAISTGRAGIMVTGSHIPFDRNGIKLNKTSGEILKSDEPGITREIERVRVQEYSRSAEQSAFGPAGAFKRSPEIPPVTSTAEDAYARRYSMSFPPGALAGFRVLVYQHSAVGRDLLPHILRELGADVATAGRSETFVALDTENITDEQLERIEELAAEVEASGRPLDAIVSTDGDSDRPLVLSVMPASGSRSGRRIRFLPGDLLGIVAAEYLGADAVAVPISANDAVELRMRERGVALRKTKIGSPYVIEALDALRRAGAHSRIVGWEANGGFLTGSELPLASATLAPLPTRDSTLPILANLFAAARRGMGLGPLWNRLPLRYGRSGLIDNMPIAVSRAILDRLIPRGDWIEVEFDRAGAVFDRGVPHAAGAPLAGSAAGEWRERKSTLSRFFTRALGFDDVARINVLDGIRIYFHNGDIAHIRPSGNAPQLRIYANSGSQARADAIVEYGIREPDGILRQLERAVS